VGGRLASNAGKSTRFIAAAYPKNSTPLSLHSASSHRPELLNPGHPGQTRRRLSGEALSKND